MAEKNHYKRVETANFDGVTLTVETEVFAANDEEASRRIITAIKRYADFMEVDDVLEDIEEVEW